MKKLLLSLFAACSFGAFAQDVSITLTSPATGSTIGPGIAFSFDAIITNEGSVDITPSDTVYYYPLINGQNYLYTVSGNDTNIVSYGFTGTTIAANGDTAMVSHSFNGLNLGDPGPSDFDLCAGVEVYGGVWNGPSSETDANNNVSCNNVNYDAGTVSIAEHAVFANLKKEVLDNSFYANGYYNLKVNNLVNGMAEISVISITGQEVRSTKREVQGHELEGSIEMTGLGTGVYVVSVTVDGTTVSAKKIIVQ